MNTCMYILVTVSMFALLYVKNKTLAGGSGWLKGCWEAINKRYTKANLPILNLFSE